LVLFDLLGQLLGRDLEPGALVGVVDGRLLLLDPGVRIELLRERHERGGRLGLGLRVADLGDDRRDAVDLARAFRDHPRESLDGRRAEEAQHLLDAELLCRVVDARFEVRLRPVRQRRAELALDLVVRDERRIVRKDRERRVFVRSGRIRRPRPVRVLRGRRRLDLRDELRGHRLDHLLAGLGRERHERAFANLAIFVFEALDEVRNAPVLSLPRLHPDERERGLHAERPGELVVRHDRIELARALLRRLPTMDVALADCASARGSEAQRKGKREATGSSARTEELGAPLVDDPHSRRSRPYVDLQSVRHLLERSRGLPRSAVRGTASHARPRQAPAKQKSRSGPRPAATWYAGSSDFPSSQAGRCDREDVADL
jgi:hypothetical protein